MNIPLDRDKPVPLARQIQGHLERLIADGLLAPGVKLPATRELAQSLRVNRATVALAYEELVAAGLARAHVGQGTFVAGEPHARPAAPAMALAPAPIDWTVAALAQRAHGRRRRGAPADAGHAVRRRGAVISFAGGMPDSALFPTDAFRRVLNQVIREEGDELLQYSAGRRLRAAAALSGRLPAAVRRRGPAEEILIVNGSQQGFDLIARTLVDPGRPGGDRAADLSRGPCRRSARSARGCCRWSGTPAGPRPDVFERLLRAAGAEALLLSAERPQSERARAWSRRSGAACWPPPPATRCRSSRTASTAASTTARARACRSRPPIAPASCIYIGTFSKILFPGLRLGWLVAPSPVMERLQAAKQLADLHTSALLQAAVHRFCERRLLDRHVTRVAAGVRRGAARCC